MNSLSSLDRIFVERRGGGGEAWRLGVVVVRKEVRWKEERILSLRRESWKEEGGGGGIKRAVIPEFIIFPAKFKIDGRTEILFSVPAVVSFISIQLVTDRCCRNKWLFRSSSSRKFWNEAVNLPNFLTSSMLRILFRPIKSVKLYLTVILDGDKYLGHEGYVFR